MPVLEVRKKHTRRSNGSLSWSRMTAWQMSPAELKSLSTRSFNVLNQLGPQIQWVQSFLTDNKIYCVYIASNEELVHEHARLGGFPANHVAQVQSIIDPTTADG